MDKIAVFPGSFDPFTLGHESVVKRALPLFDKIIIAFGNNSQKKEFFPLEKRMKWLEDYFANEKKIEILNFTGLTVDFVKQSGAKYILRGLRTSADFEYERAIAQINKKMNQEIETVFLLTTPELTPINSTIIRDILKHGGDISKFIPDGMKLI